jgi:hypothetical protein
VRASEFEPTRRVTRKEAGNTSQFWCTQQPEPYWGKLAGIEIAAGL